MRSMLKQTATISRWSSRVPDANFELTPSWSTVATGVPCSVQERRVKEQGFSAGVNVVYDAVGYFLSGVDVRPGAEDGSEGDRVSVSGKVYQVIAATKQVGRSSFLKVYLRSV